MNTALLIRSIALVLLLLIIISFYFWYKYNFKSDAIMLGLIFSVCLLLVLLLMTTMFIAIYIDDHGDQYPKLYFFYNNFFSFVNFVAGIAFIGIRTNNFLLVILGAILSLVLTIIWFVLILPLSFILSSILIFTPIGYKALNNV